MASAPLVVVKGVDVLQNPAKFNSPFQFAITFDCVPPGIDSELEWKLIYVGSAEDETRDQELESVLVGPVGMGTSKFLFEAPPPDPSRILEKDIIGVTVILLTCHYREQEFIRIGYYVSNDYGDRTDLAENPPSPPSLQDVCRNILFQKPRVTRFPIRWTDQTLVEEVPPQTENVSERAQVEPSSSSSGTGTGTGTARHDPLSWGLSNPPPSPPRNKTLPPTSGSGSSNNNNNNNNSNPSAPVLQGARPAQADMEDEGEDIGEEEEEEEDEGDDDQSVDLEEEDLRDSEEGEADAAATRAQANAVHNTAHDHADAIAMDDDS